MGAVEDLGRLVREASTLPAKISAVRQLCTVLHDAIQAQNEATAAVVAAIFVLLVSLTQAEDWSCRQAAGVGLGIAAAEFVLSVKTGMRCSCARGAMTCSPAVQAELLREPARWSLRLTALDIRQTILAGTTLGRGERVISDDRWAGLPRAQRLALQRKHVIQLIGAEASAASDAPAEHDAVSAAFAVTELGDGLVSEIDVDVGVVEPALAAASVPSDSVPPHTSPPDPLFYERLPGSSLPCTACALSMSFSDAFSSLTFRLFNSSWEARHGAALALRDIIVHLGPLLRTEASTARVDSRQGPGRDSPSVSLGDERDPSGSATLQDLVVRCIALLALDRFGDYSSGGGAVVAPVRAAAAQLLSVAGCHLTQPGYERAIDAILELANHGDWNVRHGCFMGIEAMLAVAATLGRALRVSVVEVGAETSIHSAVTPSNVFDRVLRACEHSITADSSEDVVALATAAAVELVRHGLAATHWLQGRSRPSCLVETGSFFRISESGALLAVRRLHQLHDLSSALASSLLEYCECALSCCQLETHDFALMALFSTSCRYLAIGLPSARRAALRILADILPRAHRLEGSARAWLLEFGLPLALRALWLTILHECPPMSTVDGTRSITSGDELCSGDFLTAPYVRRISCCDAATPSTNVASLLREMSASATTTGISSPEVLLVTTCRQIRERTAAPSCTSPSSSWFDEAFAALCTGSGETLSGPAVQSPSASLPHEALAWLLKLTEGTVDDAASKCHNISSAALTTNPVIAGKKRRRGASTSDTVTVKRPLRSRQRQSNGPISSCPGSEFLHENSTEDIVDDEALTSLPSSNSARPIVVSPWRRLNGAAALGSALALSVPTASAPGVLADVSFRRLLATLDAGGSAQAVAVAACTLASYAAAAATVTAPPGCWTMLATARSCIESAILNWVNAGTLDMCDANCQGCSSPQPAPADVDVEARCVWDSCAEVLQAISVAAATERGRDRATAKERFAGGAGGSGRDSWHACLVAVASAREAGVAPSAAATPVVSVSRHSLHVSHAVAAAATLACDAFAAVELPSPVAAAVAELALQTQALHLALTVLHERWRAARAESLGALLTALEWVREATPQAALPPAVAPVALSLKQAVTALLESAEDAKDAGTRYAAAAALRSLFLRAARRPRVSLSVPSGAGVQPTPLIARILQDALGRLVLSAGAVVKRCHAGNCTSRTPGDCACVWAERAAGVVSCLRQVCVDEACDEPLLLGAVADCLRRSPSRDGACTDAIALQSPGHLTAALLCLGAAAPSRQRLVGSFDNSYTGLLGQAVEAALQEPWPDGPHPPGGAADSLSLDPPLSVLAAASAMLALCASDFDSWCVCLWRHVLPACAGAGGGSLSNSGAELAALHVLASCVANPSLRVKVRRRDTSSAEGPGFVSLPLEVAVCRIASLLVNSLLPCLAHGDVSVRTLAASTFRLVTRLVALDVSGGGDLVTVWPDAMGADCQRGRDLVMTLQAGAWHGVRRLPAASAELVQQQQQQQGSGSPLEEGEADGSDGRRQDADSTAQLQLFGAPCPELRGPALTPAVAPATLRLRVYQLQAVAWLDALRRAHLGGLLCDDMGTGKSISCLAALASAVADPLPAAKSRRVSLIVAPSSLLHHWAGEMTANYPRADGATPERVALVPVVYAGTAAERAQVIERLALLSAAEPPPGAAAAAAASPHYVLIVPYSLARRDVDALARLAFSHAVLDEGHVVANPATALWRAVRRLGSSACHRVVLSGTPVQNGVVDCWALFEFVMPGYLGPWAHFQRHVAAAVRRAGAPGASAADLSSADAVLASLHRQVLPFILRRLKSDVLAELPPRTIQDVPCELSAVQRLLHAALLRLAGPAMSGVRAADLVPLAASEEEAAAAAAGGGGEDAEEGDEARIPAPRPAAVTGAGGGVLRTMDRLRRLINHPALLTPEELGALLLPPPQQQQQQQQQQQPGGGGGGGSAAPAPSATVADTAALRTVGASCKLTALRELLKSAGVLQPLPEAAGGASGDGTAAAATAGGGSAASSSSSSNNKVLVFAQSPALLDLVEELVLRPGGLTSEISGSSSGGGAFYARIDASTPPARRQATAARFNALAATRVLLLTTRVGGLGLTLTGANTCVFLDHSWNPFVDLQAMDRAHRLGQARRVSVYRLLAVGTLEDRVMGLQRFKARVAEAVVGGGGGGEGGAAAAGVAAGGAPGGAPGGGSVLDLLSAAADRSAMVGGRQRGAAAASSDAGVSSGEPSGGGGGRPRRLCGRATYEEVEGGYAAPAEGEAAAAEGEAVRLSDFVASLQ